MTSVFKLKNITCLGCSNGILKEISTLQGVFNAKVRLENNTIEVKHTDEISRIEIENKLHEIGLIFVDPVEQ